MSKEWPDSIKPMSEDEWLALANSDDAKEQQQVSSALKKLGYGAREFVRWSADQRVETIMKHQPAVEKSSSKSSTKKRTASKSTTKKAASKRSRSSSKSSSSDDEETSSSSGGGGGLGAEGLKLLKAILEGVENNAAKLEELEGRINEIEPFIHETHYGFSCIALGDEDLANNFENPDVQEDLLGVLALQGGEDDDEGEE